MIITKELYDQMVKTSKDYVCYCKGFYTPNNKNYQEIIILDDAIILNDNGMLKLEEDKQKLRKIKNVIFINMDKFIKTSIESKNISHSKSSSRNELVIRWDNQLYSLSGFVDNMEIRRFFEGFVNALKNSLAGNDYCCSFGWPKDKFEDCIEFEKIKCYAKVDGAPNECNRSLLKCCRCGKLFLYQMLEYNQENKDCYYKTYIQVDSIEEADKLNESLGWHNFSSNKLPEILIHNGQAEYRLNERKMTDEEYYKNISNDLSKNGVDMFWALLVVDYFKNQLLLSGSAAYLIFNNIKKYDDILNDFTKSLVQKKYNFDGAITVSGYTAQQIHQLNPNFTVAGVYSFLSMIRDNMNEAKRIIANQFQDVDKNNNYKL